MCFADDEVEEITAKSYLFLCPLFLASLVLRTSLCWQWLPLSGTTWTNLKILINLRPYRSFLPSFRLTCLIAFSGQAFHLEFIVAYQCRFCSRLPFALILRPSALSTSYPMFYHLLMSVSCLYVEYSLLENVLVRIVGFRLLLKCFFLFQSH